MNTDERIMDEKVQYDFNKEASEIVTVVIGK